MKKQMLVNKIQKAEDFIKNSQSDEVAIYLTPSELKLIKIALYDYEN